MLTHGTCPAAETKTSKKKKDEDSEEDVEGSDDGDEEEEEGAPPPSQRAPRRAAQKAKPKYAGACVALPVLRITANKSPSIMLQPHARCVATEVMIDLLPHIHGHRYCTWLTVLCSSACLCRE
jgi:hypothetical protein